MAQKFSRFKFLKTQQTLKKKIKLDNIFGLFLFDDEAPFYVPKPDRLKHHIFK